VGIHVLTAKQYNGRVGFALEGIENFEDKGVLRLDRIKFDSGSDTVLVWKFPTEEIRLGGQLIVNQLKNRCADYVRITFLSYFGKTLFRETLP
jgi:hypothetical protein